MTLKDLPAPMRPRERALEHGLQNLSDAELIALVLKTGYQGCNGVELAQDLLMQLGGLKGLLGRSLRELMKLKGIKLAKATQLLACVEIVRRLQYEAIRKTDVIRTPQALINWLQTGIGLMKQEAFLAVFLDIRNQITGYSQVFKGTATSAHIQAREIYHEALRHDACQLIVAHNHPSGAVQPSQADISVTEDLRKAGRLMNIPLLDHVIVSGSSYYSFRENGHI